MWVAMDQFISQAANRYMFGGQAKLPVTLGINVVWIGCSGSSFR